MLLLPEVAHWAGARLCATPIKEGTCGVLVLGSPGRRMQEHRVGAAAEVMAKADCAVAVFSGGSPHSDSAEGDSMAEIAQADGIPDSRILVERESRNTWENVKFSANALGAYDRIYIVSDGLHVHRGKRYLCRQQPLLCPKAYPFARYRFGELYLSKAKGVIHESVRYIVDSFRKT